MTETTIEAVETTEVSEDGGRLIPVSEFYLNALVGSGRVVGTIIDRALRGLENSNASMLMLCEEHGLVMHRGPTEAEIEDGNDPDNVMFEISPVILDVMGIGTAAGETDDADDADADEAEAAA